MLTRRDLLLNALKTLVVVPLLPGLGGAVEAVVPTAVPFTLPKHFVLEGIPFTLGNDRPLLPPNQRLYVWQYFSDTEESDGCSFYQCVSGLPEEMAKPENLELRFDLAKRSLRRHIQEHQKDCLTAGNILFGNN